MVAGLSSQDDDYSLWLKMRLAHNASKEGGALPRRHLESQWFMSVQPARVRISFSRVSISASEFRRPGAIRAYCVAYGVTLATLPWRRTSAATWAGDIPATSKHTMPADGSGDKGVWSVIRRMAAS